MLRVHGAKGKPETGERRRENGNGKTEEKVVIQKAKDHPEVLVFSYVSYA
jgi:hypothetical protein